MDNDNTAGAGLGRIKALLNAAPGKKDVIWAAALYIVGVGVHFLIGCFPKRISVLADEALYFSMAQSIHDGGGFLCLNAHTGFNKIMYPLVLSPFFGIDDPVLRVNMITLFNSALIMSSVVWVFLIGRELGLRRGGLLSAAVITLLFPDLMYSSSFLSENLSFPLVLLAVLILLKSKKREGTAAGRIYSAALGALCYTGYLCKNTFLAFPLTYVLFETLYPLFLYVIFRKDTPEKRLCGYYRKDALIGCGIALAVFAVCYAAGNMLLFGGGDNNAVGAVSGVSGVFGDVYKLLYLLYAFAYYLAAAFIAVIALPIAYPAAHFKAMKNETRDTFAYLVLYLVLSCAMIAYTIGINEDLGSALPRVHLRYIGAILLLLIVAFLKALQDDGETDKENSRGLFPACAVSALLACGVFKGMNYNALDQSMLNVYLIAAEALPPLTHAKDELTFYPASAAVFVILLLVAFVVTYYAKRSPGKAACIFTALMLVVFFQNNRPEAEEYRYDYTADTKMISDIAAVNAYLDSADGEKRILYIASDNRSGYSKTLITYFTHARHICHSNTESVSEMAGESGVIDVVNADFVTRFYSVTYTYDKFGGFDYIIADKETNLSLTGVTPIAEASGEYYILYKNDDPASVELIPPAA